MKMLSVRLNMGVARLAEHEVLKFGVAGSKPIVDFSFYTVISCGAAHLSVIRLPYVKYRGMI